MIGKSNTNLCQWHITGKPLWWPGEFFLKDCRRCEEKAAKNPSVREAPTPEEAFAQYKTSKRLVGKRASVEKRKAVSRAAMAKEFRETIPGRETA